jgi:hypothetical protein
MKVQVLVNCGQVCHRHMGDLADIACKMSTTRAKYPWLTYALRVRNDMLPMAQMSDSVCRKPLVVRVLEVARRVK